jgi:hypothetical protein
MTVDQALSHSYERVMLLSNAAKRARAETALRLSQAIVAGTAGDKDSWARTQQNLIDDLQTGL